MGAIAPMENGEAQKCRQDRHDESGQEIAHHDDLEIMSSGDPAEQCQQRRGEDRHANESHGMRSAQVAMYLQQQGFGKLFNLGGGVAAWAAQVDPAMPTY